ncbi:unnamed protein product, partial [Amoebophrya sp. A120]|eukprot:GSA120T00021146001.1
MQYNDERQLLLRPLVQFCLCIENTIKILESSTSLPRGPTRRKKITCHQHG